MRKQHKKNLSNSNPTAPKDPQTHCFKKLTEIESYSLDEIEVLFITITNMIDTGLKPSTGISGGIPVAAFSSVGCLPCIYWIKWK